MAIRYGVKKGIVIFMHLFTWPLGLLSNVSYKYVKTERIFDFFAKLLSLLPGHIGQYVRSSFYRQTLDKSEYDLSIGFGSFFAHPNVQVGRKVVIGHYSIIGSVILGNNVLISSRVSVMSGKYQHDINLMDGSGKKIQYESIKVGDNCWIGENAIVMASIGDKCVVSAGSVVTKPAPSEVTAIGNPARFLKRQKLE